MENKILTISIIGTGSRGAETYGRYFFERKDLFRIESICDIDKEKLEKYKKEFEIKEENCFDNDDDFFKEKRSDTLVIATLDNDHVWMAIKAIELGYNILLEKPITTDYNELIKLQKIARKSNSKILVCHVLRYTIAMQKLKEIIEEGNIGRLISIDHLENVGYWHQAHSFVRGNWRNSNTTSPMIMQKCCHDLDLLQWFAKSKAKSISSFGALNYFKEENAPEGSTKMCVDCPHVDTCPYSAKLLYIERFIQAGKPDNRWPFNVLTNKKVTEEELENAIKTGPYGRCVFHSDNNVVDSQSTNILFENGITANLKMTAFNKYGGRYIHFFGTMGELIYDEQVDSIKLMPFNGEDKEWHVKDLTTQLRGHGGGDINMMNYLYEMIVNGKADNDTSLDNSIESHLMAIYSEKSRIKTGKIVKVK